MSQTFEPSREEGIRLDPVGSTVEGAVDEDAMQVTVAGIMADQLVNCVCDRHGCLRIDPTSLDKGAPARSSANGLAHPVGPDLGVEPVLYDWLGRVLEVCGA